MTKLSNNNGSNASAWRERSIVKRSSSAVCNLIETMTLESPFLLSKEGSLFEQPFQLTRDEVIVGKLLGHGSFSYVHEVEAIAFSEDPENDAGDSTSRRNLLKVLSKKHGGLAIKHLRQDLMDNITHFEEAAADLIMEAKYLAALDHPNVIKLRAVAKGGVSAFESGQHDGFFLVTDKLQGTLKDKILEWQFLDEENSDLDVLLSCHEDARSMSKNLLLEKINLAHQIAKALAYLHENRLVYRDLKPLNCGLTGDNTVKLFDFGFCRCLPESSYDDDDDKDAEYAANKLYCMSGKGSLMYMAPEVIKCAIYNCKADVYSWSMVFYELLTLNKPFPSMASAEAHRELVGNRGARPALKHTNIPMPVQRLLRDAWNGDISRRLTMSQVCQRLEQLPAELESDFARVDANVSTLSRHDSILHSVCDFWGLLDLQCGYKATPIRDTIPELQDDSLNSLLSSDKQIKFSRPENELYGNATDDTMESSVFSTTSLYLNPIMDDPSKEVSHYESRSAVLEREGTEEEKFETEDERIDGDREANGDVELRCPASPLARRASAPQQRRQSLPGKQVIDSQWPAAQRRNSLPGKQEVVDPQWPAFMEVPV